MVDTQYIAVAITSGKEQIKRTHSIARHVKKDRQGYCRVIAQYQAKELIKYTSHAKTSFETIKHVDRLQ